MAECFWIDTNLLLRLITEDPEGMTKETLELVSLVDLGEIKLRASSMVVAECVWVLESVYEYKPGEIAKALRRYLTSNVIEFDEKEVVERALDDYEQHNVDFIDAYVACKAKFSTTPRIITWDRDFRRLDIEWFKPPEIVKRVKEAQGQRE